MLKAKFSCGIVQMLFRLEMVIEIALIVLNPDPSLSNRKTFFQKRIWINEQHHFQELMWIEKSKSPLPNIKNTIIATICNL